jgi:hypothetical protein
MSFTLTSNITITNINTKQVVKLRGVNDCRIKKGIHSYIDTATLKIPLSGRLKQKNGSSSSVETAQFFYRGDKVKIELGYDNKLKTEFIGFISRVNFTSPCEIECEGYSFQLRQKNINKTFAKGTQVNEIIAFLIQGTDIVLSNKIPNVALESAMTVNNATACQVLDKIKENQLMTIYFNGNELYVGLQQTEVKKNVKYRLGWNTIKDNGLKFQLAEDKRVKVILKVSKKDGDKALYTTGDPDGEVHEYIVNMAEKDLKHIAEDHLLKMKFTGFEGKITTLLVPYCEHACSAEVEDTRYSERNGTYFVPSVEVVFGTSGTRRIVELSNKLSV